MQKKTLPLLFKGRAGDGLRITEGVCSCFAERGGFEPPVRRKANNGFRDRRIRPLCHLSKADKNSNYLSSFNLKKSCITVLFWYYGNLLYFCDVLQVVQVMQVVQVL